MRVVRLHAPGDLRLHDEPAPVPAAGEELVRIGAVGLCGSDRHWFEEGSIGDATISTPLILGHELAGTIAAGPRAGTPVVVDPADPCGRCAACARGAVHLCARMRFAGHGSVDGGMRELLAWPSGLLHPLPARIGLAEATLLEPLGIALHALALSGLRPGSAAAVLGAGPIGLLLIQLLRMMVCDPLVATDREEHRVAAARRLGASQTELAGRGDADAATSGLPQVDVAFEAAGDDDAVRDALHAVRPGGRVILIGIPERDMTSFPASLARRKELSLQLCRRTTPADLAAAIGLAASGRVDLATLITERHPLAQAAEAFRSLVQRRGLKVVVEP